MKTCIQTFGILAIAASLSYGEDAPAKPDKAKRPNPEAMFKKLDTSGDGSLSLDEVKASPKGQKDPAKAEGHFKKMDGDSSGGVSLDEFKAAGPPKGDGKGGKHGKKKKGDAAE
jgi:hypothetical protein